MPIRLSLTSLVLLICLVFPALAVSADEGSLGARQAHPTYYLPWVTAGGESIDLAIAGIEITQSTQTTSNSVPLVAGRPTVVRVYATSDTGQPIDGVTVSVSATRDGLPLPGSPLRAGPKSVAKSAERSDYQASFNVLLPPDWLHGDVSLVVTLDADNRFVERTKTNNTATAKLTFYRVPPLNIVIVPVQYTHTPSGRVYPPPSRDTISSWIMRTYPVSDIRVSFHAPLAFSGDLSQSAVWEDLLEQVTSVKYAEDAPSTHIYYALVPTENGGDRWFYGGMAGIGWVGLRAAVSLDFGPGQEEKTGRIAAHEIGHNLRRYHAPCGTSGDARQPFPYPGASLGDQTIGLDIMTGRVWTAGAPDYVRDVMSYCTPQWLSDYTYSALYQEMRTAEGDVGAPAGGLLVRGAVAPDGTVALRPVYAVSDAAPTPAKGGAYVVELLGSDGAVLARHPVDLVQAEAPHAFDVSPESAPSHEPDGTWHIQAVVPLPPQPVAALRVVSASGAGKSATAALAVASVSPAASSTAATVVSEKAAGGRPELAVRWEPADVPALVRYSADGRSWTTLGVDVVGGELRVDPSVLPGGGAGRFEVLPAGGAPVQVALQKAMAAADAPPEVWITAPDRARAGEPVLLYGRATDREDGAITALTWTVDGEYAGDKQTLQIGALPPGTYQIALVATDSAGQSARATHTLIVAP